MTLIWLLLLATKIWEQRKLGEIFKFSQGLQVPIDQQFERKEENTERFIRIVDVTQDNIPQRFVYNPTGKGRVNLDDIFFVRYGAVGTIGHGFKGVIANNLFKVIPLIDINPLFWFYQFSDIRFNSRLKALSASTSMPAINFNTLRKMIISNTSIVEQNKIGTILKSLDNLLTLYERKTRLLSKLRTFLTQRLFSNSSKVSLYFDNKNWSKHKISEFLTERNEKVIPNPSIPLVSFTVEKGVTPKSKRYNREFLVKDDKKKYKITKKNDIVYNPANLKFGAIARNKFGNAAFSPIYVTFITKLNPAFTEFLVRRKNFINLALKYQEGTVYERMAVKSKDFLNLKIYLPNSSRDINHIAQILQSLDTLVSLNKNKVSLITLIKKELLNTMFI